VKRILLILSIVMCVSGCSTTSMTSIPVEKYGGAQTDVIPSDFKLVLNYFAGGFGTSDNKQWSLTISADRRAVQSIQAYFTSKGEIKKSLVNSFRISKNDLNTIINSIKESDFFTPIERGPGDFCMDCSGLAIEVTMDGKSGGCGLQYGNEDNEAIIRRLWSVSKTVLEIIPSPNNNKELNMLESYIQ
jgi:hypothetical protein